MTQFHKTKLCAFICIYLIIYTIHTLFIINYYHLRTFFVFVFTFAVKQLNWFKILHIKPVLVATRKWREITVDEKMSVKQQLPACKIAHVKRTLKTQKIIHITKKLIAAQDDLYLVNIECTRNRETIQRHAYNAHKLL